jgi:NTP pyrophosphatase (non-canonical NTP hydrolase)
MLMDEYQREARSTAIYRANAAVIYPAMGLANEAGEVLGKVKKKIRDGVLDKEATIKELGDVLWYLAILADDLHTNLSDVAQQNLDKLRSRQERGTLQGNGDNR